MRDLLSRALGELRHEPLEQRVRARLGAEGVVDRARGPRLEPRRVVPSDAVPEPDVRAAITLAPAEDREVAGGAAPGDPVRRAHRAGRAAHGGRPVGAGFRLADADLVRYVVLDFAAFVARHEEE